MKIAIVTLEGFNELDSFVALAILNRAKADGVHAEIVGTGDTVTSMNGVSVSVQRPLSFAQEADAAFIHAITSMIRTSWSSCRLIRPGN